jgi:hypothetical protein
MKQKILFCQIAALISLCSIAEARIQTPGAVTTGPFSHAAAVAQVRLNKDTPKPQATQSGKAGAAPAKEKQTLRKRLFGRKSRS